MENGQKKMKKIKNEKKRKKMKKEKKSETSDFACNILINERYSKFTNIHLITLY